MAEQTYGEGQLYVSGKHCGVVHLQDIHSYGAILPRLFIRLGIKLIERPAESPDDKRPVQNFRLANIRAELRLSQASDGFAVFEPAQNPDIPYSEYDPASFQQVSLS